MIRMSFIPLMFFLAACVIQDKTSTFSTRHYKPSDEKIKITGRVLHQDSVGLFWSASSVKMKFRGASLKAQLRDEKGKNYFNVVIDGDSVRYVRLDSTRQFYTLASGLPDGEHTVELIKGTEYDRGSTWFYGVQVIDGELLDLPKGNNRFIEFYGNSITAGYAIDDNTGGDSPDSSYTNNYYTYAALTARHFDADYHCIVKSGIGIMVSWFPMIMPELYYRHNPNDSSSRWNFSQRKPDIVVVNLMQNDSWLVKMPDHPSFKQRFGTTPPTADQIKAAYNKFVSGIRHEYPDAHIICALGSMDATAKGSVWPGYVTDVVNSMNDSKIYTLFFPFTAKDGHPRRAQNEEMAKALIEFIDARSW
jgi:hypothetical protein